MVMNPAHIIVSLLAVALLTAASPARANDDLGELVDREIPALKDGTRMALADVERAILAACARGKFRASVVAPGMIKARRTRIGRDVVVMIPFTESAYSIHYGALERLNDKTSEQVTDLAGNIESDLDRALVRFKSLQKPTRRARRINPRYAA